MPRQTNDIDVLARLTEQSAAGLAELLQTDFYVDQETARHAVAAARAFNAIHLRHAFKFDIFPVSNSLDESRNARLDAKYMEDWAGRLRVLDLLQKAVSA